MVSETDNEIFLKTYLLCITKDNINYGHGTLLVPRSEYPRDKPFLLTMVSYFKKSKKIKREKKKSREPFQSYLLTGQA